MELLQPSLTTIGKSVLEKRYLKKNEEGAVVETPQERFLAVAKYVAQAERNYGVDPETVWPGFYEMMATLEFLPNTPCIVNADRPNPLLSACIVLPIEDSMASIFGTLRDMALVHQSGAGSGFDFSSIRPKGDYVKSNTGIASGPISFMNAYNHVTECVKQGGVRRGASIGILRVDHPDILDFITCKRVDGELNNFNISVGITNAFMTALALDEEYDLVNPRNGKITQSLRARDVFSLIVENAHYSGDPGLFFIDRVNELDPLASKEDPIEAPNPCVSGDTLILTANGVRRIDSCVGETTQIWNGRDWSPVIPCITGRDQEMVRVCLTDGRSLTCTRYHRFYLAPGSSRKATSLREGDILENCRAPDGDWYPMPEVAFVEDAGTAEKVYCFAEHQRHRGVFNGILTGQCGEQPLHPNDACDLGSINLTKFYNPQTATFDYDRLGDTIRTAVRFLDDVHDVNQYPVQAIYERTHAHRRIGLGVMGWADVLVQAGIPYASNEALILAGDVQKFMTEKAVEASEELAALRGAFPTYEKSKLPEWGERPRRNGTVTTQAPTGSISIIAGCSSGIEPLFAIVQTRQQADMTMVDVNPMFAEIAKREGFYSDALLDRVKESGTVKDDPDVPEKWQRVFAVANEIDVEWHIEMQAAFQKHVQCAISKTINASKCATVQDVERAYKMAWDKGCKGITIYRDQCREGQTLSLGAGTSETSQERPPLYPIPDNPYDAKVWPIMTPTGKLNVKLCLDQGRAFEMWFDTSRPGTAIHALSEALGRLGSLVLRLDSPIDPLDRVEMVAEQLSGLGGGDSVGYGPQRVLSLPDGAAQALRTLLRAVRGVTDQAESAPATAPPTAPNKASEKPSKSNGSNGRNRSLGDICPDCHQATLHHAEGCAVCICGFSRC